MVVLSVVKDLSIKAINASLPISSVYLLYILYKYFRSIAPDAESDVPISVNYFPCRKCNYECGFRFHTDTSGYILPMDDAKRGLRLLKEAGLRKLNIAGGEPFLQPKFIGEMIKYCKETLKIESVSIVSNGSKIQEAWMEKYAKYLDILAISCDSFKPETNIQIGRGNDGGNVERLYKIAGWCEKYNIKFKLNTVVNTYNWDEGMTNETLELQPFRWKVVQCLIVAGENDNETRVRDARKFLVTDEQWCTFVDKHKHLPKFVPEDNKSTLEVGVKEAMKDVVWDKKAFDERGGVYDWTKQEGCGTAQAGSKLDW